MNPLVILVAGWCYSVDGATCQEPTMPATWCRHVDDNKLCTPEENMRHQLYVRGEIQKQEECNRQLTRNGLKFPSDEWTKQFHECWQEKP